MKKIIIFFTNKDRLEGKFGLSVTIEEVLILKESGNQNHQIWLVNDQLCLNKFKKHFEGIKNSDHVEYVFHSQKVDEVIAYLKEQNCVVNKNGFEGRHEPVESNGKYYPEIEALKDNEGECDESKLTQDYFNKLWWQFESKSELEQALNLLHNIYSGKPKNEFETSENKEIREHEDAKDAYITLIGENSNDDWTYDYSCEKKLADLRDKLLTIAMNNK